MKRDIVWTTKFKKDYKLAIKRHMDIGLLDDISPIWHSSNVSPFLFTKLPSQKLPHRGCRHGSFYLWKTDSQIIPATAHR